jgi:hypothetical protein
MEFFKVEEERKILAALLAVFNKKRSREAL